MTNIDTAIPRACVTRLLIEGFRGVSQRVELDLDASAVL